MPYPVENLIEGRGQPTTVRPAESAQKALALMIEHDFSQLPVVDEANRPLGMVTYESILRALNNFGVRLDDLRVSNAIDRAQKYHPEDDLFDLLNRLKETNAVLIVDGEDKLIGIVTSYDSTEYFRRRAEDLMLVEDIEGMVKDLILATFTNTEGEVDQDQLTTAIEATDSERSLLHRYRNALQCYLELQGHQQPRIDPQHLSESFSCISPKEKGKSFDDLTLADYIGLLLDKKRWQKYQLFFDLAPEALRTLLDGVRDTRNMLAHFRGELSSTQRDQLRFCTEWLERHPPEQLTVHLLGIPAGWPVPLKIRNQEELVVRETAHAYLASVVLDEEIAPTEEPTGPTTSRYAPLASWLQAQTGKKVRVSFAEVEEIIGAKLPDSARRHRSWWANDAVDHAHARQWLDAGWRVSTLNMATEEVEFFRIKALERAYIDFFNTLKREFVEVAPFEVKPQFPTGANWQVIFGLPLEGLQSAVLAFSFAARSQFRVELYIGSGERDKNKEAFDQLYAQKEQIEAAVREPLSWERMDDKRGSRIALYRDGAITDGEEKLEEIRRWAIDAMRRFYEAIGTKADEVLRSVGA